MDFPCFFPCRTVGESLRWPLWPGQTAQRLWAPMICWWFQRRRFDVQMVPFKVSTCGKTVCWLSYIVFDMFAICWIWCTFFPKTMLIFHIMFLWRWCPPWLFWVPGGLLIGHVRQTCFLAWSVNAVTALSKPYRLLHKMVLEYITLQFSIARNFDVPCSPWCWYQTFLLAFLVSWRLNWRPATQRLGWFHCQFPQFPGVVRIPCPCANQSRSNFYEFNTFQHNIIANFAYIGWFCRR